MIEIQGLKKRYPNGTYALKGVTAKLGSRVTAVIGRNGAGKTTMVRILSTQLEPSSGSATIDGLDIMDDASKIRARIASIPQEVNAIGFLTPSEHLQMYLTARGMSFHEADSEAARVLKAVELWKARDKPTDTLSGGMKRKMFVAMALASNADTVFLDEPTTGLDPLSRLQVWSAIRQLGGNVLLTTHYMEEAEHLADEVVLVDSGKIIDRGTVPGLLRKFTGRVRVEGPFEGTKIKMQYKIANMGISYVSKNKAEEYVSAGFTVRPVSLEDLFIVHGVELES